MPNRNATATMPACPTRTRASASSASVMRCSAKHASAPWIGARIPPGVRDVAAIGCRPLISSPACASACVGAALNKNEGEGNYRLRTPAISAVSIAHACRLHVYRSWQPGRPALRLSVCYRLRILASHLLQARYGWSHGAVADLQRTPRHRCSRHGALLRRLGYSDASKLLRTKYTANNTNGHAVAGRDDGGNILKRRSTSKSKSSICGRGSC